MEASAVGTDSLRHSKPKTRQIKKYTQVLKTTHPRHISEKDRSQSGKYTVRNNHNSQPEGQIQMQSREITEEERLAKLHNFWSVQIDKIYKKPKPQQLQLLKQTLAQQIPTLTEILTSQASPNPPLNYKELHCYLELIMLCQNGMLIKHHQKHFLAVLKQNQLNQLIQLSQAQAQLITKRMRYMQELEQRQAIYNLRLGTGEKLSQLTSEMAFLLYQMRKAEARIQGILTGILSNYTQQEQQPFTNHNKAQDEYIACLIKKNLQKALANTPIDYLNHYPQQDTLQLFGISPQNPTQITDKKQFQQYVRRKTPKRNKRSNPKSILKTACGACLSPHFEPYNPFDYCGGCHTRFHRFCYRLYESDLCETCEMKKYHKVSHAECLLCNVSGLLTIPLKNDQSAHVFCLLVNNLWTVSNSELKFLPIKPLNPRTDSSSCSLCNGRCYVGRCLHCGKSAHAMCAFMGGWNMKMGQTGVELECDCRGIDVAEQSYRRRFMLNYEKIVFRGDKGR